MIRKEIKTFNKKMFEKLIIPFYSPSSIIPIYGKGSRVFDRLGKDYIDFSSGIGVTALGHCNFLIQKSLVLQSKKLWHISNLFVNEPAINLAQRLNSTTSFSSRVFFSNSGAEANEAAFKLARYYSNKVYGFHKNKIVSFLNSFHGRTFFTVCVGGQFKYSDGFGPKPSEIFHIPYNDIKAIKSVVDDSTCAVVVEPIQGEGGVIPAKMDFMQKLRNICNKHDVLLIVDEIQTGMGRTGKLYCYEHYNIEPDIITLAKALGSGFPIGATLVNEKISKVVEIGIHGSTYGGNPLSCAIAETSLKIINSEKFLLNVRKKNKIFVKELLKINRRINIFNEIRGKGLLLGIDLKNKYKNEINKIILSSAKEGVLILKAGKNVIRLLPPLNIKNKDIKEGMFRFYKALKNI
ncbi:Acetylornithine/succinyldiaminopimelate aminotransferase [Buchnera aphidicola (Tetraneura ulmi)]|uniref:acetylornithine/succinyldiaminopimelate transaminase n=1 Tax=Buchnera aphidicola TaxID=9 RepID=UPI0034643EBA